eukprot:tig00000057_g145.t1
METGESIFNLIPMQEAPRMKPPQYKSMHPPELPEAAKQKKPAATMGRPVGKPDPKAFVRAGEKTKGVLPEPKPFMRTEEKKPSVPRKEEKPIMNLKSEKNFITANAVENILMVPKRKPEPLDYTKKPDYGKVPQYLEKVKTQIAEEYEYIRNVQDAHERAGQPRFRVLAEDEKREVLSGLKQRWEVLNRQFQTLPVVLDTVSKKKRKEDLEAELANIEKDIQRMSKEVVVVADD